MPVYYIIAVSCGADPVLVMVGMVASVEERGGGGGGEVERELMTWLERNGVEDPHGYFTRHLTHTAASHQVYTQYPHTLRDPHTNI